MTRSIVWPTVGLWSASTPGGDVMLVLGPEPALRWRLFSEQVVGVATKFDASMLLTLGALLADVPHSRPVQMMGTATDQTMIDRFDLQRSRYEGPTGIVGVLHDACAEHRPAVGIAVGGRARVRIAGAVAQGCARARSSGPARCSGARRRRHGSSPRPASTTPGSSAFVGDDDDLIGYVVAAGVAGRQW